MQKKISNKFSKKSLQNFHFFTEENWEKHKEQYFQNIQHFFSGKKNEVFIQTHENSTQYLIGLGKNPQNFEIQEVASKFSYTNRKNLQAITTTIHFDFNHNEEIKNIVKGLFLGTYSYPFEKNHVFYHEKFELVIENISDEDILEISKKTDAICNGQFAAMEWLNKPANHKKVSHISEFLQKTAEKYSFEYSVFDKKKSEELGLGAFLSVNQGSSQDAAFTILEYKCEVENAKTVGLVGKCVLFDTGGISIKPADNMHYMKSDLGGATAVFGALIAAAEMKIPVNLVAILPITDNAVSNNAFLPSDVIKAYNGKTIEVLNTDAEGRMTLADGLSYLSKNYKTDALIDLATLTGSSVRMFGYTCGALFSNNKNLQNLLEFSADKTNQRLWNLPLWDIWKDDILSDVADFKNISMKPFGDCIVAAKFLEQFTENHQNWAHLDIAGVAFGNVQYAKEKAATGYGVQLLVDFLENYK